METLSPAQGSANLESSRSGRQSNSRVVEARSVWILEEPGMDGSGYADYTVLPRPRCPH